MKWKELMRSDVKTQNPQSPPMSAVNVRYSCHPRRLTCFPNRQHSCCTAGYIHLTSRIASSSSDPRVCVHAAKIMVLNDNTTTLCRKVSLSPSVHYPFPSPPSLPPSDVPIHRSPQPFHDLPPKTQLIFYSPQLLHTQKERERKTNPAPSSHPKSSLAILC